MIGMDLVVLSGEEIDNEGLADYGGWVGDLGLGWATVVGWEIWGGTTVVGWMGLGG